MELTYHRNGDYLFPNLTIEDTEETIGKYGMLRQTFLKENRSGLYEGMLLTGNRNRHLLETEKVAMERMKVLMKGLLQKYPAPDEATDQMTWVAHINGLMAMAEESVLNELVYS